MRGMNKKMKIWINILKVNSILNKRDKFQRMGLKFEVNGFEDKGNDLICEFVDFYFKN